MKLATYQDGSRDGQLLVVSRDLQRAHFATSIATRLQQLLDDWNFVAPQLHDLYQTLNQGKARHALPFEPARCMAPLPRAYQWAAGGAEAEPAEPTAVPQLVQRGSDELLGAHDDAVFADAAWGIDFQAELAVVTGDVALGTGPDAALDGVRLLLLANAWCLRESTGAAPAGAFAPLAVTPDELGDAWRLGRAQLRVEVARNAQRVALIDAAAAMRHPFGQLIAHIACSRRLRAGSIVGSGCLADAAGGHGGIAAQRAHETRHGGGATTAYLGFGERVRIEAWADDGQSVFGAIDQRVVALHAAG